MDHPWKEIALSDYERHMSQPQVGQLTALDQIMGTQLLSHPVDQAMILGVAGGNGLEHVWDTQIKTVYGVDINPDYLAVCKARYPQLDDRLILIQADISRQYQSLPHADLLIADLLVEYIGCPCFGRVVRAVAPTYVSCVIQEESAIGDSFVSPTAYASVFDGLERVHQEITEEALSEVLLQEGYRLTGREQYPLPNGKSFWKFDHKRTDESCIIRSR